MDGERQGSKTAELEPAFAGFGHDARFRARSAWLARTERDLAAAGVSAAAGCPDWHSLVKQLQAMLDAAADAACLTALDRERLAGQARSIACIAYRHGAEELLDRIEAASLREDAVQRDLLLGRADGLMRKLKSLKLETATYDGLSSRLTRLRREGAVAVAQPAAERRALVGERRLFPRYREPQLTVQLGNQFARSVNWSLGGLLLAGAQASADAPIALATWIHGGHRYEDQAVVMRKGADGSLALKLRRFGSHLVDVKQECERRGLPPRS